MMKSVLISLFVILLSSCSYTPSTTARSDIITEPCHIEAVDPNTGTVKDAIEANEDNWYIYKPICTEKFKQINKYDESKKEWWQLW